MHNAMSGSFGVAEGQLGDLGLEGAGTVSRQPDGSLIMACKKAPGAISLPLSILGGLLGVVVVAIAATMLDELAGIDLMAIRKGPVLVGMVGLFAAVGGWLLMSSIARRLFGRPFEVQAPAVASVSPHDKNERAITVAWLHGDTHVGTTFTPADAQARAFLLRSATT